MRTSSSWCSERSVTEERTDRSSRSCRPGAEHKRALPVLDSLRVFVGLSHSLSGSLRDVRFEASKRPDDERMGGLFAKLLSTFYSKQLEVVLVGLENSGKTTLLNVLSQGAPAETVPTIGLNVKLVKKGGVTMKCWDIGGQQMYRSEWGRYAKGCDCIIFVVDAFEVRSRGNLFVLSFPSMIRSTH